MSTVEVIEGNINNGSSGVAQIDDAHLEMYYRMHRRVHEKSEEISKTYKNDILIKFSDIEELHHKITQSIKSSNPYNSSVIFRVIATHLEGEAEKFNSFDDFAKYNKTSPNPTLDITLIYKFSLLEHETQELESYKIVTSIRSRIGDLCQIEKEAPAFISSAIISSIVTPTARIKVEYSDYVKAIHFTAMFDDWIKGCDESKEIGFITKIKPFSHYIPKIGRLIVIFLLGFFVSHSIGEESFQSFEIANFIVLYATVFFMIVSLSEMFFSMIENSIDRYLALSYISLNKGDAKLIESFKSKNKASIQKAIFGAIGSIAIAVAARLSYDFIKYIS